MSYSAERDSIVNYLNANFLTAPIDWENAPGSEPSLPFIQPFILNGESEGLSLDFQSTRYPGVISINAYFEQGTGTKTSNTIADELVALLHNQTIGSVETFSASKVVLPATDGRYQITISAPFERRE